MKIKQHSQFANYREVVIDGKPVYSIANNRAADAEFEQFLKLIAAAPSMLETLQEVHKRLRAFERDLDQRQDATSEADREIIIDIDLGIIAAINAAATTESTMHPIFENLLKPFGIK